MLNFLGARPRRIRAQTAPDAESAFNGWQAKLTLADLSRARSRLRIDIGATRGRMGGTGRAMGRLRGAGSELESIGPYQPGDDPRHIDWSATARTTQTQVRRFVSDSAPRLFIALDLRSQMFFGSDKHVMARQACLAAAALINTAHHQRRATSLFIVGTNHQASPAKSGRRARLAQFSSMIEHYDSGLRQNRSTPNTLAEHFSILAPTVGRQAHWVIVSDFSDLGDDLAKTIASRAPLWLDAVAIEDPMVERPWPAGRYPLRVPDQARKTAAPGKLKDRFEMIRIDAGVRPATSAWRSDLNKVLRQSGVHRIQRETLR